MSDVQTAIKPDKKQMKIDVFGCKPEDITPGERKTAITGYELRHRIEALVSGITDKKISHRYHGDGAATAPGVMILPSIPLSWLFRKRDANVILGYAAHEISHQLETPFDMVKTIFADINKPTAEEIQLKNWWNAVEDYRIEKLTRKNYPGFPMLISETRDHSARRFNEAVEDGAIDAERLGNPYALGAVGLTWIGARLNQYPTAEHEKALGHLSDDLRAWVEGWEGALAKVETPTDALELAKVIMDSLKQEPEEEDPQDSNGQGEEPDDQQDGDSEDGQTPNEQSGGKNPDSDATDADDAKPSEPSDDDEQPSDSDKKPGTKPETGDAGDAEDSEDGEQSGEGDDGDAEQDADGEEQGDQGENADGDADSGADSGETEDSDGQDNDPQNGDSSQDNSSASKDASPSDQNQSSDPSSQEAQDGQPNGDTQGPDASDNASEPVNSAPAPKVTEKQKQAEPSAADLEIDEIMEQLASSVRPEDRAHQDIDEAPAASSSIEVERNEKCYAELRRTLGPSGARSAGVLRRMLQSHDRVRVVRGL